MKTIKPIFQKILHNGFGVQKGEEYRALSMQLLIFLIISTLLIVKPTVNSLFIAKFGVKTLPIAFILVAITAGIFAKLYSKLIANNSLGKIIFYTLSITIALLIVFNVLLKLKVAESVVLFSFYIGVALFAVIATSQFWILANVVFNELEAKRLFGFIGAGAIAGGIFGGYLTSFLAKILSSENLLLVGASFLIICLPIVENIWKDNVIKTRERNPKKTFKKEKINASPFQLILRSKHLTYMAGIIGISVVVAKLVDYQFSAIASDNFQDKDELTAFFGFWFSTFNVISLLIQLIFTRWLILKLGVTKSLYLLPIGLFVGAFLVFLAPALWSAIFIKMNEGSLKQSINKAAVELLALPIPSKIKSQTKTFIDVVVDSVATGIGGLILIFFVSGLNLSIQAISLIIFGLTLIWIYFVWKVRTEYYGAFKMKTQPRRHTMATLLPDLSGQSVQDALLRLFDNGTDRQIMIVLKKVKRMKGKKPLAILQKFLHHKSPRVRKAAFKSLIKNNSEVLIQENKVLINDTFKKQPLLNR